MKPRDRLALFIFRTERPLPARRGEACFVVKGHNVQTRAAANLMTKDETLNTRRKKEP